MPTLDRQTVYKGFFRPQLVLDPTADPYSQVQDLWRGGKDAKTTVFVDCLTSVQAVYWKSLADTLGRTEFNDRFRKQTIRIGWDYQTGFLIQQGPWTWAPSGQVPFIPGDWLNFPNLSDYGVVHPGGLWGSESVVLTKLDKPVLGSPDEIGPAPMTSTVDHMTVAGFGVAEQKGWDLILEILRYYAWDDKTKWDNGDLKIGSLVLSRDNYAKADFSPVTKKVTLLDSLDTHGFNAKQVDALIDKLRTAVQRLDIDGVKTGSRKLANRDTVEISAIDFILFPRRYGTPNVNYGSEKK